MTDITVLNHLAVVNLDVHIWSARCKLTPPDLGNAELPPEELASLGSKRICNPEELKTFTTLKARAVSVLERNGVRFLNGWAIPVAKIDDIGNELSVVRDEFNIAKDAFLQRYEQAVQDWIAKHPQWASIIAHSTVSEEYVRGRMGFKWQMFRIVPPQDAPSDAGDNLHDDISNLGNALFGEVAAAATETWHRCYAGKQEITRKALSPLKTMYEKLMGLTFVEPRVAPVAELIKTAFDNIPKRGPVNGGVLLMLQGLVSLLCNPAALLDHAQKIVEGKQQAQDMLEGFINDPLLTGQLPAGVTDDMQDAPDFGDEPLFPVLPSNGLW
jgi:hypothetical protein